MHHSLRISTHSYTWIRNGMKSTSDRKVHELLEADRKTLLARMYNEKLGARH